MFDADRPILLSAQDRLNRATFAKYLARCMLDHESTESLVIGLYGGWGVGKTSIINMAIEELNFAATNLEDNDKPVIMSFNAWNFTGQRQLLYHFFHRLMAAFNESAELEGTQDIIELLEVYASYFRQLPFVDHQHKNGQNKIDFNQDLLQVKKELNTLLLEQNQKIIIVIDNISQLYDHEIKQMFQLMKSIADFTNTTYLITLNKDRIISAINKVDGYGGEEFIEKIIQMPFIIPPIMHQDLEIVLADRLNEIVAAVPLQTWNKEYWADIYHCSLKYFFRNCRDITRYVNTLAFSYQRMRDTVNPVDYFALTAIEVFFPDVYFGIRDNKDLFTDLLDQVYPLDQDEIRTDRERCNEILARQERVPTHILLNLLMALFPRVRRIYQPDNLVYHSTAKARKLRRVCSPDLFDAYFRLSMQVGSVGKSEFELILSLAADAKSFDQALTRLNQDERITHFLDMLDSDMLQSIPKEHIQAIITALLDNGDLFPHGIDGPLSLDTPMRIHRIIQGLLSRYKRTDERFDLMQDAIAYAEKSIYIIVHELYEQSEEHSEEHDTYLPLEFRLITPEQLASLKALAVNRIEKWAKNGTLAVHPQLIAILFAWNEWGDAKNCQHFIEELIKTDRGILSFLTQIFSPAITQTMSKYEKDPAWKLLLAKLEKLIPISSVEPRAVIVFESSYFEKISEREQLAILIFLELIHAKTKKIFPQIS